VAQVVSKEVANCVSGSHAATGVAAYITTRFLDLVHIARQCVGVPVDAAWIFLVLHSVVFERIAKTDMLRFGYDERTTPKNIEVDCTADVTRILGKVKPGPDPGSKRAGKVRRSTLLLLDTMISLMRTCDAEYPGQAKRHEYGALGCEMSFIIYGSRGMQCEANTGEVNEMARAEMIAAVMGMLRGRWGEYVAILDSVGNAVGQVVPYTGGTVVSPLHIIAHSMYEEHGITAAEFEVGLGLPAGSISNFHFPQAAQGFWGGWANVLLKTVVGIV
jgi:hypothetical protein